MNELSRLHVLAACDAQEILQKAFKDIYALPFLPSKAHILESLERLIIETEADILLTARNINLGG
jgi:hypothetical protein